MSAKIKYRRITQNPSIMGGKACIRGMRVTVSTILGLLASGKSTDAILADYPYLESRRHCPGFAVCRMAGGGTRVCSGRGMKLLLDINISPRWVKFLQENGVESSLMTWISAHCLPTARTASRASFSSELTISALKHLAMQ